MSHCELITLKVVLALLSFFVVGFCKLEPKIDATQMHGPGDGDEPSHNHLRFNMDDDDDFDGMGDDHHLNSRDWYSLSSEQQSQALTKFFDRLDINKDKFVSREEMIELALKNMQQENVHMARDEFRKADENSDGHVTWEEFWGEEDEESAVNDVEISMEKTRFNSADIDQSGTLTLAEFEPFFFPYDYPHMKDFLLQTVLSEYDNDKNKELSKEEFAQISTDHEDFEEHEEAFDLFDVDKNGVLNENELYDLLSHSGMRLAQSEVDYVIKHMSTPLVEGKWSFDEISQNIDNFLESQFEEELFKHTEL